MVIGLDFDGTCVTHEFPKVGKNVGAVPVLIKLVNAGHKIMLWTMRSDNPVEGRQVLTDALNWFAEFGIPLYGINENPEQKFTGWSTSYKQYAQYYIDDAAIGCPLIHPKEGKPYVDWKKMEAELIKMGLIN